MNEQEKKDIELYKKLQKSPLFFIQFMWGLSPQPIREEQKNLVQSLIEREEYERVKPSFFLPFSKGKNITWQQYLIVSAVERAVQKKGKNKITVASGHGIGKSNVLAMLILWYLFAFKDAQIPCTAPTAEQMHDILWKEIAVMLKRMPEGIQALYEWSNGYIRIVESPETWFARAKTARKESPEALAGVHGDYVFFVVDESSGVPDEIFNTAEGAMTGDNVLVLMISNPTRLIGYFYDSHNSDSQAWIKMQFSSKDSPIVNNDYVARIIDKHGEDSEEYAIRVLGQFPKSDAMDDSGYIPLIQEDDIKYTESSGFVGGLMLGVDPSGEGRDETIWVLRDSYKAKILHTEKTSTAKSIAEKTLTFINQYNIKRENVYIDNFGVGANVAQELGIAGVRVNGVNVGDKATDERFMNLRAEVYWKIKEWMRTGGEFISHDGWKELLYIRYKNNLSGKLQIMPKLEMKKKLGKSPDHADALSLTFIRPIKRDVPLHKMRKRSIISNRLRMA